MKGTNPVRVKDSNDGSTLWVQEVFATIQGEGPFVGTPAIFVRLAGCNLRCHFCDTEFESSTWRPSIVDLVHDIREKIATKTPGSRLVVLTGGEPLRQNVLSLITMLNYYGLAVQIETAGTLWWDWIPGVFDRHDNDVIPSRNTIVCSPKTPTLAAQLVPYINALKYIVRAGEIDNRDGLPDCSTQSKGLGGTRLFRPYHPSMNPTGPAIPVYLQPCDEGVGHKDWTKRNTDVAIEQCLKHGYKLCLQTHKMVGLP